MSANKKEQKNQIVVKEFDEEKLAQELGEIIRKDDLENYTKDQVGFFSYSDASAGIGGGIGHFLWFDSYHNLYQFLADYFVVLAPGRCDLDHEQVFKKVADVIQRLAAGKVSTEKAIIQINEAGKHFSQIEWIGELKGLTEGNSEFEIKVRETFFKNNEKDNQKKINKEDLHKFIKFLSEYGF